MTGLYPIHTGMQGYPMLAAEPRGLPLRKILPQYLKDLGYVTRAVGKWHLGFYRKEFTPTYRGFDSHLGYWTGSISYYDHIVQDIYPDGNILSGHDFRRNMDTAWNLEGQYATEVFTEEALRIIEQHDTGKPLFLYLSHLAVHAGNTGKLLEAPQEIINTFRHIKEPNRRTYAAMVSQMDESVGRVVEALHNRRMLNNSIIVFISDNGAPSVGVFQNWGSNYPLRGIKATLWEGGVRGVALIWSPLLRQPSRVSDELMHVSDWLPTLYSAAGGDITKLDSNLDGVDQWSSLVYDEKSPRRQVLVNIDEREKTAALIIGDWKLVVGTFGNNGSLDGYYGNSGNSASNPRYNTSSVINSRAWKSIASTRRPVTQADVNKLRQAATVSCSKETFVTQTNCNPSITNTPCLFNIHEDPCEQNNLSGSSTDIVTAMYNILVRHRQSLIPQLNRPWDISGADPARFNSTWSSWLD
ncbi:hypothetical protein B7P43_G08558 [Cryptotermes secundus]|nr:arylsulfatase I isoform X2 [Cryptotermes secundus]PNF27139.1 hypothetical protein B7P43_G08558 [Cryptotermes secundus]